MMRWTAGLVQHSVGEAQGLEIQALHKGVDHPDRVVRGDVFVQGLGEEELLVPISAFDVVHGDSSLDRWKRCGYYGIESLLLHRLSLEP